MGFPNRIVFLSPYGREEQFTADAAITPGMQAIMNSDLGISPHNVAGGRGERMFAMEHGLIGYPVGYLDAYNIGDPVQVWMFHPGDVGYILMAANGAACVPGAMVTPNGDGTQKLMGPAGVLYENTAQSAAVGASSTATLALPYSYTIPANTLLVGDQIRIRLATQITGLTATPTMTLVLNIGATAISSPAAWTPSLNDDGEFEAVLTILGVGASGLVTAIGWVATGTPGTAAAKEIALTPTTINTTVTQAIGATAAFSTSGAGNAIVINEFYIELIRGATQYPTGVCLDTINNSAVNTPSYFRCRFLG